MKTLESASKTLNKQIGNEKPEGSLIDKVDGVEIYKDVTAADGSKLKLKRSEDIINKYRSNPNETGVITTDDKGNLLLNNEPLFVGNGDEQLSANLKQLLKSGVKGQKLTQRKSLFSRIMAWFQPSSAQAASGPVLEYVDAITYQGSTVGYFKLDGEQAFCVFHDGAGLK
ncbi:hypothetical protein M3N64_09485 [Sporolactobacillus sp. CPB3-1]|uniref:Uncharacterized protein n=1 Tax=Sporolactobacillus mangiferae TaxID=2940498 RepID=A0ABT0MBC7_9BACL|nr:hypothetical protein [Sporolactobacillus mangiferae]MCL1632175.1 hypothetical protein [Sporolactobacillus mangiferae]